MYQGILILTCTMTMVCLDSEHHSHLKCTWKHCRLLFVSMYGAVSFLRLFDNLSLKLGNLHVNQWIYRHFHSHDQWCRFHFLSFPSFCLPPVLLSVMEVLFLFAEIQRSLDLLRILPNSLKIWKVMRCSRQLL